MHPFLEKAQQLKQQLNWSLIFGVSFFLVVIFSLVQITTGVTQWLVDNKDAQIKHLSVQGSPKFTDEKAIIRAIKKADLSSFFELDVKMKPNAPEARGNATRQANKESQISTCSWYSQFQCICSHTFFLCIQR